MNAIYEAIKDLRRVYRDPECGDEEMWDAIAVLIEAYEAETGDVEEEENDE